MKNLLFLVFALSLNGLFAQLSGSPDTLLKADFQFDPEGTMLPSPGGNDLDWVNFDADGHPSICLDDNQPMPSNWYWESDLGEEDNDNWAMTSCSFFSYSNVNLRNRNWLILPPVVVPSEHCFLSWRSSAYWGPAYVDGYQVLVSTGSNDPADGGFTDTLFRGAETLYSLVETSLNVNDHVFSPGYLHADGYTDNDYFEVAYSDGFPFYRGKLEPHVANLGAYAGQQVYIAFLHDSRNQYQLQVDDIVILVDSTLSAGDQLPGLQAFHIAPNPVQDQMRIEWLFREPEAAQLLLLNILGQVVWQENMEKSDRHTLPLSVGHLPPGHYQAVLRTPSGSAARGFVRQ